MMIHHHPRCCLRTARHALIGLLMGLALPGAVASAATLNVTVNASEPVTVTGTPRIAIDVGGVTRYATYVSGSGTASLTLGYAVQAGDFDANGITLVSPLDLNGGTITDSAGNPLSPLAFTLPDTAALKVETCAVAFTTGAITNVNAGSVGFSIAKAPVGASFSYAITSSGGAGSVTGSGTISGATHTVSGIDVSALPLGTLTLSVTLSTAAGGTGAAKTATATMSFTGPLDGVPAAAAYSVRLLRSAYSGPLLRVRRATDSATQDIGATAVGDLNTAALRAFCGAASCFVTTWYDRSGNGRNASQLTAASQPRIVNAGTVDLLGSRPGVRFLATAQALGATAPLGNANEYTLVMTMAERVRRGATAWRLLVSFTGALRVSAHAPYGDGVLYYDQGSASAPSRISTAWPVALGTPSVTTFQNSAAAGTRTVFVNGTALLSGTGIAAASDTLAFGETYNGNYAEFILLPSALASASRLAIERSAGAYFGVTVP